MNYSAQLRSFYKTKHRDASLATKIYAVYQAIMKDDLTGIIMCGGAGKEDFKDYEGSDIDYIVVVSELTPETILLGSLAQAQLQKTYNAKVSQTVITAHELASVRSGYAALDGKAVQAIIEARVEDLAGLTMKKIPVLSETAVKQYSRANFVVLQALLRKTLIRSAPHITKETKVLLAKLALIVQKMHEQTKGTVSQLEVWQGREELQDLKLNPEKYSDDDTRQLIVGYLNLNLN